MGTRLPAGNSRFSWLWSTQVNPKLFKNHHYKIMLEIAAMSTLLAVMLYIMMSAIMNVPVFEGIIRAIVIPTIIAPLMCRRLFQVLIKVDLTEEALQNSETRYRDIFENTGTATIIVAQNKKITMANTEFTQLSGYDREEIEGKMNWTDFVAQEDLKRMENYHLERRKENNGAPAAYEFQFVDRFGNTRQILVKVNMISGTEESVAALLDITEIVKVKSDLKESEKKFRSITASAKDAIIMMNGDGKTSYWNEAAEKMFGYANNDILGKELHQIIAPQDYHSAYQTAIPKYKKSGDGPVLGKTLELTGLNKDGLRFPIELSVSTIKLNGEWHAIGIIRDISERKKLEEELRHAHKMEAIGTLAGGIAHDFNNILSAIIGYTELSKIDTPEESKVSDYLDNILEAGNRAKELIQQILIFSRQGERELKPVLVKEAVKEALKLLRASLPSTIDIRQNILSDAMAMSDPIQIHQILMNLGANAGHAMQQKGGILQVDLKNVQLDSRFAARFPKIKPGLYVNLTVSDTGVGMRPEVQKRIFDPFFTTKQRGKGTGMGLAVVHGIVERCGGIILSYSEPGNGSVFKVYLPVSESTQIPDKAALTPLPEGRENILLVDDEPHIVEIGTKMLESLGYGVVAMTNPMDALDRFRAQPHDFDLVITDKTMPSITGDKLIQELFAIRNDIPVILCTGFNSRITGKKIEKMGIDGLLQKPYVQSELAQLVRKVLDAPKSISFSRMN